jgi:hypothetical protein
VSDEVRKQLRVQRVVYCADDVRQFWDDQSYVRIVSLLDRTTGFADDRSYQSFYCELLSSKVFSSHIHHKECCSSHNSGLGSCQRMKQFIKSDSNN